MAIWFAEPDLEKLNAGSQDSLVSHLGIEFIEVGEETLKARMPVDQRTVQPLGLLHGGASVALAETLGSIAATLCVDSQQKLCVGLEINANHVRAAHQGYVIGTVRPLHLGTSTHVWEIHIHDEAERLICISRITMAILDRKS